MFVRRKRSGPRTYLQVVENRWENGKCRQRVVATLGRLDVLKEKGQLDGLVRSAARLCEALLVLDAHETAKSPEVSTFHIGPALVFERLWRETGCGEVLRSLLKGRRFRFPVERAVFVAVLHRLFHQVPDRCSDREANKWRQRHRIEGFGPDELDQHHFYRAMAWLGEELPESDQQGRTPFAPRTTKDLVEERLFARRRDLFTDLDLVFFDTTSIYFEGEGGQSLGKRGKSKDHRPDLKQMVVGAVLDNEGRPLCCELWPGNTSDVTTLVPIATRLQARFGIAQICVVADRGMISKTTMAELERRGWHYILGARMRSVKEVRDEVLSRAGRYHVVHPGRKHTRDPSPLKVKEVKVEGRRYVVCINEEQRRKDAADRAAIIDSLRKKLAQGDKALVGNKGYRKFIGSRKGGGFQVDQKAIEREQRNDGKWVLRTNTSLPTAEVALKYKQLWMVEAIFRSTKSLLDTRPIYHRQDETIRGHVFCSFLALVLRVELQDKLARAGLDLEWGDVVRDLDDLVETEILNEGKRFLVRSAARGISGKVCKAVGVALPPTVRRLPTPTEADG